MAHASHLVVRARWTTLVVAALIGCSTTSAEDEGSDETGDEGPGEPQACAEPGSPLLDEAAKPSAPEPGTFVCSTGWATDAASLSATWSVSLGQASPEFGLSTTSLAAHPAGGVVIASNGLFAHVDADGQTVWSNPEAASLDSQVQMIVEASGNILLGTYDWNIGTSVVARYDGDGNLQGTVDLPFNTPQSGQVWALVRDGAGLLVGAIDQDQQGSWETTLLRLDADGNLLLRKSTNMTNSGLLGVNEAGTIVFGQFPTFLVDRDSGAVLGNLTPSSGQPQAVAGLGADLVMAGSGNGDLTVGRYTGVGSELWLQSYDRAGAGEIARAVAVGPDGTLVAAGLTGSLASNSWWFGSEPVILAVDADGNPLWIDRIDALGEANAIAFASDGALFVAGAAEVDTGDIDPNDPPPLLRWVRRYDP